MKHTKALTLAGYTVEYIDLREPKPREHRTETAVFTKEDIAAAQMLGLEFFDIIKRRYSLGGYYVLGVSREVKKTVTVDLGRCTSGG